MGPVGVSRVRRLLDTCQRPQCQPIYSRRLGTPRDRVAGRGPAAAAAAAAPDVQGGVISLRQPQLAFWRMAGTVLHPAGIWLDSMSSGICDPGLGFPGADDLTTQMC